MVGDGGDVGRLAWARAGLNTSGRFSPLFGFLGGTPLGNTGFYSSGDGDSGGFNTGFFQSGFFGPQPG
jgi:hypothetical protein